MPKLFGRQLDVEQALYLPQISVGKGQFMWNIMDTIRKAVGGREPIVECQSIETGVYWFDRIGIKIVPSYEGLRSESLNDCIQFFELSSTGIFLEGATSHRRIVLPEEQFLTQEENDLSMRRQ